VTGGQEGGDGSVIDETESAKWVVVVMLLEGRGVEVWGGGGRAMGHAGRWVGSGRGAMPDGGPGCGEGCSEAGKEAACVAAGAGAATAAVVATLA
jgi:hypothetical protein